jgi:Tol biopolymer transport system component/predicted Ser/Thr protein kinase
MSSTLLPGARLGRYEVKSQLGAGGMGEVYLAEDTRLHRKVALKILPTELAANKDRMRRFEQEAQAAAALNHPNIAHIYEIGESGGVNFIAMEFVDGATLREKIHGERTELKKLLRFLQHAAEGLAKAHAASIVHRDLKPDNIMITRDGHAKILDFGLAKLIEQPPIPSGDSSEGATAVMPQHSSPGTVMGTVGYMSPEQAQGKTKEIDQRSDVFSFGCILYEAATGLQPFASDSVVDTLHKIIHASAPPIKDANPSAPFDLQRIVRRCLAKDPDERYQSIKEVAIELRELRRELEGAGELDTTVPPSPIGSAPGATLPGSSPSLSTAASASSAEYIVSEIKRHKRGAGVALVVLISVITGVAFGLYKFFGQRQAKSSATSLRIIPFTSFPGRKSEPAFSADGNQIAFVWDGGSGENLDIYLQLIDGGTPLRLTTNAAPDLSPCWAPDGRRIAFIRSSKDEGGLYMVPALGGPERKLASFKDPLDADWSPDGKQIAVTDKPSPQEPGNIFLVSVESGEKRKLPSPSGQVDSDQTPRFSPDGRMLAFIHSPNFLIDDIYLVPTAGGEPKRLTFDNRQIAGLTWTSDGREIVFSSNRGGPYGLWRLPVSGGSPEPLPAIGENAEEPAISRHGSHLAYTYLRTNRNIWRAPGPSSTAKSSAPTKFIASTRSQSSPQYSPDGGKIAFASDRSGSPEIWVCDSERQNPVQLTNFGRTITDTPRWSPDGRYIAFDSRAEGSSDIYVISVDGGSPRRLTTEPSADITPVWSKDGRWIYFGSDRSGDFQLWKVPSEGGQAVQVTKQGGYATFVSPDDKYIYYTKQGPSQLSEPGIWRVPVDGGEEVRIFDKGFWGETVVLSDGICFLDHEVTPNPNINFFSVATRQVTRLATIEKAKYAGGPPNLTVSPDGKWVLYWQVDQIDNDIMLVENFR